MKKTLLTYFLLLTTIITFTQEIDSPYIHHTFYSEAFGEERKVTVHLPSIYIENPTDSFMVTYLLDAQGPQFFNMMTAGLDYLTSRSSIIPTLVVGIHSKDRFIEFTPAAQGGDGRHANFESQLPNLHEHFEKEVFPLIEKNYRAKPYRVLIGHSRGGSFVFETLFDGHHDLFDAYVAISPALGFNQDQTLKLVEQQLKKGFDEPKYLYYSSGNVTEQEKYFEQTVLKVEDLFSAHPPQNMLLHKGFFQGNDHFATVMPALTEAMVRHKNEFMPSFERLDEFANQDGKSITRQMMNFVKTRQEKYGFAHMPSNRYFTNAANEYMEAEQYAAALDLYIWANRREPLTNWWEVLNMGKCYYKTREYTMSNQYFFQALDLLEQNKERYGANYDKILADVRKQIEEMKE